MLAHQNVGNVEPVIRTVLPTPNTEVLNNILRLIYSILLSSNETKISKTVRAEVECATTLAKRREVLESDENLELLLQTRRKLLYKYNSAKGHISTSGSISKEASGK